MLFDIFKAVILGIVEGFSEFLPISSTGHLILANHFFSFSRKFTFIFDIVIQLGAILAILALFWQKLSPFKKDNKETLNIWLKTIIGVLPALVFGFLFVDFIESKLFNPKVVALSLIIGGIVLILAENRNQQAKIYSVGELPLKAAFYIGVFQCLAMIPGCLVPGQP